MKETINALLNLIKEFKELLTLILIIIAAAGTGSFYVVDRVNSNTETVSLEMWEKHLTMDSLRIEIAAELAARVLVRQDSLSLAIQNIGKTHTAIIAQVNQLSKRVDPDTVPVTAIQRDINEIRKMITDAEDHRIREAAHNRQMEQFLIKATNEINHIKKGDRKP